MTKQTRDEKSLAAQIAGLPKLGNRELHELWRKLYDTDPPKTSRLLIIRKLAWRIQEMALGGLNDEAQKELKKEIRTFKKRGGVMKEQTRAGVIFERVWNGETYRVKSQGKGFEYEGRWYRSLTAIARKITGSHTSGPRFFGLREDRDADNS